MHYYGARSETPPAQKLWITGFSGLIDTTNHVGSQRAGASASAPGARADSGLDPVGRLNQQSVSPVEGIPRPGFWVHESSTVDACSLGQLLFGSIHAFVTTSENAQGQLRPVGESIYTGVLCVPCERRVCT